ncbi:hypothetical protein [Albirhodobacter sp. R86504]|uniref:hypothetical protein n=1 Tax=Albirhodobacter sp. R86504 TaxID=3093848 RepID=UPI00366F3440
MTDKPFNIDLGRLKTREKDRSAQAVEKTDRAGEKLGFVTREPQKSAGASQAPVPDRHMPR